MRTSLPVARSEWEHGYVRFREAVRDPVEGDRLHAQLSVVTAELRRRVGGTYTLQELADVYIDSERWLREAVADLAPSPGWPRTLALVGDAAFHLYARGAIDFTP